MQHWIDNETVKKALTTKSTVALKESGVIFCISDNFEYCIFIRKHAAWEVENEDWRDANETPKKGESWRWVLNFYKKENS